MVNVSVQPELARCRRLQISSSSAQSNTQYKLKISPSATTLTHTLSLNRPLPIPSHPVPDEPISWQKHAISWRRGDSCTVHDHDHDHDHRPMATGLRSSCNLDQGVDMCVLKHICRSACMQSPNGMSVRAFPSSSLLVRRGEARGGGGGGGDGKNRTLFRFAIRSHTALSLANQPCAS